MEQLNLMKKISKNTVPLGSFGGFYNGIKTGDNNAYLTDKKINEMYKLVYRGRDVHKYYLDRPQIYVLFDKSKLWSNTNEKLLRKKPKLLIRQTGDNVTAAIDENGFLHMDTTHSLFDTKANINFLIALLNSRLVSWWHRSYTSEEGRAFAEVKIVNLKEIPIKKVSENEQKPLIEMVQNILELTKSEDYLQNPAKQAQVQECKKQIDQMVYQLYGLTSEEIALVEERSS